MNEWKWLLFAVVVASWCALARFLRLGSQQDEVVSKARQVEDEEEARRRALAATGKPMKPDWLLRNSYAKDGRDHR